ncbi:hypothetical protein TELCIR_13937 [Teladorsagia circumcincta]|uniref:Ig-like domain-containing protein n=1 Tax=Teladorsagia circumcincta TaxID=45464 RepID=A0A2G9U2D7_TELCI|nr:hypothetical protein TELCIR_13937 [Teladorsagia circumcincta]
MAFGHIRHPTVFHLIHSTETSVISEDSPPILVDVVNGAYAYSPIGELIVSRSATVTFSCLSPKRTSKSKWEFSSTYRSYPQLWTRMEALGAEKVDANQLTVTIAQPEDSGLLHCILPSGKRNTIRMRVEGMSSH